MRGVVIGLVCVSAGAFAAAAAPPPASAPKADAADAPDDDIVVNGKVPPGAVIGDVPPENQLTPADIASYGVDTVSDLLAQITEQTESDQGRDSSAGPVILVNGKRVSGIDEVGDLPAESILRVDILPEEVALKYGYDAQQKVVNIILRRHFLAKVASLSGGGATDGAGETQGGELSFSRIHDDDRVNLVARVANQASVLESDRGVSSTGGAIVDPTGRVANDSDARTLKPATDTYTLNAVVAHALSKTVSATVNTRAQYETSRAFDGLPSGEFLLPGGASLDRYLGYDPLRQDIDTATAHGGVTIDVDLPRKWQLSVIGAYDHDDVRTGTDRGFDLAALQAGIDDGQVDPYGVLSPAVLGRLARQQAVAVTDSASSSALIHGNLFKLPAGSVLTSVRVGGDFSRLAASITGAAASPSRARDRSDASAQLSFDLPLTSRARHVLGAIGDLSANVNGSVRQVSDFGALGAFGYGLHWTPLKAVSIIASENEDRVAPTLAQLDDPAVTTANARVYDFVQGRTVTVTQLAGGNPGLKADDRHVFKLGLSIDAVETAKVKLTLTADYIHSVTRDAIGTLASATADAEEAFPDRFTRGADGTLVAIDARPVNFDRESRSDLRWGVNFTRVLRAPRRWRPPPGFRPHWRRDGEGGGRPPPPGESGPPGPPPADAGGVPGAGQDIIVDGPRGDEPGGGSGAPPPPPDSAPPPGGWGGDGHGRHGGFGGPGGFGHHGPPGGFGGAGNGAQLQLSVYHSWYFRDDVRLAAGGPTVDLLDGGTIGAGGQARHKVDFNAGLFDNGLGVRLNGTWISPTRVDEVASGAGALRYSALATFNLRLFADLQQRFRRKPWARGTRISFSVTNLLDSRQHVRDATGATPLVYQPAFLDPYGRTVSLTVRRIF